MAALVCSTRTDSGCPRRPLENPFFVEHVLIIAKILFIGKTNAKKSQVMSNLFLSDREAAVRPPSGSENKAENQWAALCAAHEIASKKPESLVLVYLYSSARTYFIKNS